VVIHVEDSKKEHTGSTAIFADAVVLKRRGRKIWARSASGRVMVADLTMRGSTPRIKTQLPAGAREISTRYLHNPIDQRCVTNPLQGTRRHSGTQAQETGNQSEQSSSSHLPRFTDVKVLDLLDLGVLIIIQSVALTHYLTVESSRKKV
jgi:hypothetical protein